MGFLERRFQAVVTYGGVLLAVCVIANVYFVLRYMEVYRDELRSQQQFQRLLLRQQAMQGVLHEFVLRANTDPQIRQILQRAQAARTNETSTSGAHP